ncbi:hypothetical protein MKX01_036608 [Papaver californicum]|nr:hypothetical protein MKX01_036608 [Papaver californicum]
MARTSLVISIAFTGFIMLSIARPYKAANVDRTGTIITDLHDGVVHDEVVKGANGLATAEKDGYIGVNGHKGEVNLGGNTRINAADWLVDVQRNRPTAVNLHKGEVTEGGKIRASALKGLANANIDGETVINTNNSRVEKNTNGNHN